VPGASTQEFTLGGAPAPACGHRINAGAFENRFGVGGAGEFRPHGMQREIRRCRRRETGGTVIRYIAAESMAIENVGVVLEQRAVGFR